jgi:hypothetical protein
VPSHNSTYQMSVMLEGQEDIRRGIKVPRSRDVLFGRGGESNHNAGNRHYQAVVEQRGMEYAGCEKRKDKTQLAWEIFFQLKGEGYSFLKKDRASLLWFEASPQECRKKISQRLRERALEAREKFDKVAIVSKEVESYFHWKCASASPTFNVDIKPNTPTATCVDNISVVTAPSSPTSGVKREVIDEAALFGELMLGPLEEINPETQTSSAAIPIIESIDDLFGDDDYSDCDASLVVPGGARRGLRADGSFYDLQAMEKPKKKARVV